jgi:hypothetical protein
MNPVLELENLMQTENTLEMENPSDFPDAVLMISLGSDKYAAINTTTPGADPMEVNLLVVFPNDEEADVWEKTWKLTGTRVSKKFNEARDIAVSKPNVAGLGLQINARTASIHWVR